MAVGAIIERTLFDPVVGRLAGDVPVFEEIGVEIEGGVGVGIEGGEAPDVNGTFLLVDRDADAPNEEDA